MIGRNKKVLREQLLIVCIMHPMGFEPMRVSTTELKTVTLGHSVKGAMGDPYGRSSHLLYSNRMSLDCVSPSP